MQINGQEGLKLDTSEDADLKYFDWLRAHTNSATGALWISFHTRNTDWVSSLKVHAATTAGKVLFDGSVSALTATPPRGTFLGRSSSTTAMHTDRWSVTAWFLCCFK